MFARETARSVVGLYLFLKAISYAIGYPSGVFFLQILNKERLNQARSFGCETVDVSSKSSLAEQIEQILGSPEVDCAVDCVGFEAHGHGADAKKEAPATVLNSLMELTRAGGSIGIPGLYVTDDPGAVDAAAKVGALSIRLGLGWAKSHTFQTGQTPVLKYNRQLMQAILRDKIHIAKAVNVTVISLDDAPKGYVDFDKGAAKKFVIDPHALLAVLARLTLRRLQSGSSARNSRSFLTFGRWVLGHSLKNEGHKRHTVGGAKKSRADSEKLPLCSIRDYVAVAERREGDNLIIEVVN